MLETQETSSGEIKYEVYLFNNLTLLVIEIKFTLRNTQDYFTQNLLELGCEIFFFATYFTSNYINLQ